jgi:hypothetical protein
MWNAVPYFGTLIGEAEMRRHPVLSGGSRSLAVLAGLVLLL